MPTGASAMTCFQVFALLAVLSTFVSGEPHLFSHFEHLVRRQTGGSCGQQLNNACNPPNGDVNVDTCLNAVCGQTCLSAIPGLSNCCVTRDVNSITTCVQGLNSGSTPGISSSRPALSSSFFSSTPVRTPTSPLASSSAVVTGPGVANPSASSSVSSTLPRSTPTVPVTSSTSLLSRTSSMQSSGTTVFDYTPSSPAVATVTSTVRSSAGMTSAQERRIVLTLMLLPIAGMFWML